MARTKQTKKPSMEEQAWRAVERFRQMHSTLEGFCRAVSGNPKLRLVGSENAGTHSSRDKISVRVPFEFGNIAPHVRAKCFVRDENLLQTCPACAKMEEITFPIYHECAHVGMGSHIELDTTIIAQMAATVNDVWSPTWPKWAMARQMEIRRTPYAVEDGPASVAGTVHPWMLLVFNITEDIRVDTRMCEVRPGLQVISEGWTMRIFREGEMFDGELMFWKDQPLDRQILVAITFLGMGYDMQYFSQECQDFIAGDPHLNTFAERSIAAKDALESFRVACELLYYLHTLGMYDPPVEEEEDNDPGNESDQNQEAQDGQSESGEGGGGDGEDSGSPDDQEGKGGGDGNDQADGDKSGGGTSDEGEGGEPDDSTAESGRGDISANPSDEPGDGEGSGSPDTSLSDPDKLQQALARGAGDTDNSPLEENAIKIALLQADYFDAASQEIGGVKFHPHGESKPVSYSAWVGAARWGRGYPSEVKAPEALIGSSLNHARRVFSDNSITKRTRGHKSGRLVSSSLGKRAPVGDPRMFGQKVLPNKKSYFVQCMFDISGSNREGNRVDQLRSMAAAEGELFNRLGVSFGMHAHTAHMHKVGLNQMFFVDIYPIKDVNEPWGETSLERICDLVDAEGNLDGHAMEWARKQCDASPATNKIILYETDGQMPALNGPEEGEILRRELETCKRKGYTVIGVGLDTDSPKQYGLETVIVTTAADIRNVIRALENKLATV